MKPQTRRENFIAKIAGDKDAIQMTPDPNDRMEGWLNAIAENGGGGGASGIVCNINMKSETDITALKTAGELWSAVQSGSQILFHIDMQNNDGYFPMTACYMNESGYAFCFSVEQNTVRLIAGNASDFPVSDDK